MSDKCQNMTEPKVPSDLSINYGPTTLNNPWSISKIDLCQSNITFGILTPFGSHKRHESQVFADLGGIDGGGNGWVYVIMVA